MTPAIFGWLCFALAVAGAVFLFQRMRASEASREDLRGELETSGTELDAVRKRLEQARGEFRARGEEIAELRKKHEKLKKRAGESLEEERALPARVRALEAELLAERNDARAARDEIVRLHADVERASADLARERARAAELVPPTKSDELDGLKARAAEQEAKLTQQRAELENARRDVSKFKGRWETLDKAYVILRGELELKKDEVRAQRVELERLRTLEVILTAPDAEAKPTR